MTKNKVVLISVLSALAGASVAAAQPGGAKHFEKLDANGDGAVTTAEFEAGLLTRWTNSDANKDGKVTADEFKAQFAEHAKERFIKRDANGNGVLERAEVEKMPEGLFAKIDADKSGSLSTAELENGWSKRGHGKHFGKGPKGLPGDADGDGAVTKTEAVSGAQKLAKKLDANADGKLTQDELSHRRGHHACGSGERDKAE